MNTCSSWTSVENKHIQSRSIDNLKDDVNAYKKQLNTENKLTISQKEEKFTLTIMKTGLPTLTKSWDRIEYKELQRCFHIKLYNSYTVHSNQKWIRKSKMRNRSPILSHIFLFENKLVTKKLINCMHIIPSIFNFKKNMTTYNF